MKKSKGKSAKKSKEKSVKKSKIECYLCDNAATHLDNGCDEDHVTCDEHTETCDLNCDNTVCTPCLNNCTNCGDALCTECLHHCERCDYGFCNGCLNEEMCGTCQDGGNESMDDDGNNEDD